MGESASWKQSSIWDWESIEPKYRQNPRGLRTCVHMNTSFIPRPNQSILLNKRSANEIHEINLHKTKTNAEQNSEEEKPIDIHLYHSPDYLR
jgi:hypothetical protein